MESIIQKRIIPARTQFENEKGPVKLTKRVKITHSFLQSVSNQFHVIILLLYSKNETRNLIG